MRSVLSFVAGAVACAGLFLPSLEAQDFTRQLSPEEQAAIGLAKLSAEERAALVAIVERYREQSTPSGNRDAGTAGISQAGSPATPDASAATAPSATAAANRSVRSWIPFLKDNGKEPRKPNAAPAAASDEVATRLKGDLRSFNGRRSFVLENGEVWEMDEAGSYSGPVLTSPEVILRPGILGTHVLKIPEAALRVRVRRAGSR